MAIACVRIPHFALRVAILERPELDGAPLVLRSTAERRAIVVDATPEASRFGLRPGLPLREVPQLCPEAIVCAAQPVREQAMLTRILDQLESLSPLVAADPDESGTFYIDLRGLDRHFPSPLAAAQHLLAALPPLLRPRAGVAPNLSAARLAAGCANPGSCRLIEPRELCSFLRDIAVSELPITAELAQHFERLGILTLGELAAFPRAAVAARLGPAGLRAWELATGHDDRQIRPRRQPPHAVEQRTYEPPLTSHGACLLALKRLVLRACSRPVLRDRHVRQLDVWATLEDGTSWQHRLVLRGPTDCDRLLTTLDLRLPLVTIPGPVTAFRLELAGLTPATAHQALLAGLGPRPRRVRPISEAIAQLTQRYGVSPVFRIAEVEPWSPMPERRFALIPYAP